MEIEDYEDAFDYLVEKLEEFGRLGTNVEIHKLLDLIQEILLQIP